MSHLSPSTLSNCMHWASHGSWALVNKNWTSNHQAGWTYQILWHYHRCRINHLKHRARNRGKRKMKNGYAVSCLPVSKLFAYKFSFLLDLLHPGCCCKRWLCSCIWRSVAFPTNLCISALLFTTALPFTFVFTFVLPQMLDQLGANTLKKYARKYPQL